MTLFSTLLLDTTSDLPFILIFVELMPIAHPPFRTDLVQQTWSTAM